jgi:hypothetical protein
MTLVLMVVVVLDIACCCCLECVVWLHVMCRTNCILRMVGGKPLESLFATIVMIRC